MHIFFPNLKTMLKDAVWLMLVKPMLFEGIRTFYN